MIGCGGGGGGNGAETYLALRDKDRDIVLGTGGNGKVGHAFHTQLVCDSSQIITVIKLNLIGDHAGAELFVRGVLQVPARLRLLDKSPHRLLLRALGQFFNSAPDFEVFRRIAILVLASALPGAQERAAGRKGKLVDQGRLRVVSTWPCEASTMSTLSLAE
jgi:hypothetical protein